MLVTLLSWNSYKREVYKAQQKAWEELNSDSEKDIFPK